MSTTVITVTWNTWYTYTARLIEQFFYYVSPDDYEQWIMVDSNSDDAEHISKAMVSFPPGHREKFCLLRSDRNISDLPQYNRVIKELVTTDKVVCISTDVRMLDNIVRLLSNELAIYDLIGNPGPLVSKYETGSWNWVPRLLLERGFTDFIKTFHVQTHCFGVRRDPFVEIEGFWEPQDPDPRFGGYLDKGNLIAGEMLLSLKLVKAGYIVQQCYFPAYHYGNGMGSREAMDAFDMSRRWDMRFLTEGSWHMEEENA